jgi:hypothetical protein
MQRPKSGVQIQKMELGRLVQGMKAVVTVGKSNIKMPDRVELPLASLKEIL